MTDKIIAGNWKMNLDVHESSLLVHELEKLLPSTNGVEVIIFAAATSLYSLSKEVDPRKIKIGVQNVHYNDHGPFTGEVSPHMVRDLVDYVLIGHSERRNIFGETDEDVSKKVAAVLSHKLMPVICVGENLHQRTAGETESVVHTQSLAAFSQLSQLPPKGLIVAYEPVWAISDGTKDGLKETPSSADVTKAAATVRRAAHDHFGNFEDDKIKVIYGGSANPENAADLLSAQGCDGLLPGSASLKADSFASIINTAIKMRGA